MGGVTSEKWTRLKAMLEGQRTYLKDNILVGAVNNNDKVKSDIC